MVIYTEWKGIIKFIDKHILNFILQNRLVSSWNQAMTTYANGNTTTGSTDEDTYEEDIANDIRELELRWQEELEEQEKRWSSEDDSNK